jgi:hypothetical protein
MSAIYDYNDPQVLERVLEALQRLHNKVKCVRWSLKNTSPANFSEELRILPKIAEEYRKSPKSDFEILEDYAPNSQYNFLQHFDSKFIEIIKRYAHINSGDIHKVIELLSKTEDLINKEIDFVRDKL